MKLLITAIIGLITISANSIQLKKGQPFLDDKSIVEKGTPILGTRWALVEISNNKIPLNELNTAFLIFKKDSTVEGNGGCNTFSGKYALGKNNRIEFGEMIRTNMSCAAIDMERMFINSLASADHYYVVEDTLSLNKGVSTNLVKFVAMQ